VADAGTNVLVIADGDAKLAGERAKELGLALYAERDVLLPRLPPLGAALGEAMGHNGCVVLADVADNAGGGAPSDNTALLRAMLEAGVTEYRIYSGSAFGKSPFPLRREADLPNFRVESPAAQAGG
jgi:microcystin degradation protein MlrC